MLALGLATRLATGHAASVQRPWQPVNLAPVLARGVAPAQAPPHAVRGARSGATAAVNHGIWPLPRPEPAPCEAAHDALAPACAPATSPVMTGLTNSAAHSTHLGSQSTAIAAPAEHQRQGRDIRLRRAGITSCTWLKLALLTGASGGQRVQGSGGEVLDLLLQLAGGRRQAGVPQRGVDMLNAADDGKDPPT